MRPREEIRKAVVDRCVELGWMGVQEAGHGTIVVERPSDPAHGDWATPAALALARSLRRPPLEIAGELAQGLDLDSDRYSQVSVAGPGFINVRLSDTYLRATIARILADPAAYARTSRLAGRRLNVEFVSSNPTGPLHVGHARNAALGDAIAALLESQGADVKREYYFNDAGRQMDVLGASVHARYRQQWEPEFPFPEEAYQGEYIRDLAAGFTEEAGERCRGRPLEECLTEIRRFASERISAGIRADLQRFRVGFDVWFNESTLYEDGRLEGAIADLRAAGAAYESAGATWFR
ncbi:MAG: arginine--tRNA ligase, partial [Gemmatimonadetes bacterium]|nr:arginine--tRNA ligase [Gemmatimonadota bacterium]